MAKGSPPSKKARPHILDQELKRLERCQLLIVDEVGYVPLERRAANRMFALVSRRYERGSIISTSNRGFEARGQIRGDGIVAAALIDRLGAPRHHGDAQKQELTATRTRNLQHPSPPTERRL